LLRLKQEVSIALMGTIKILFSGTRDFRKGR